jgi:DNA primase
MNLPKSIYQNFLETNFIIKNTSDPDEVRINSIFCEDKKYHLYFNLSNGLFTCFKSSVSGNIYDFVNYYLDIPKNQVIYYLIENYDSEHTQEEKEQIIKSSNNNLNELLSKTIWFKNKKLGIFGRQALNYLLKRKVSEEYINQWGYCFEPGYEFDRRIVIPFVENKDIIYAITRSIDKIEKLRYKNVTGLDSKEFVFNYDKIINTKPLVICEGVFDAISVSEYPATCLMSADIGKIQISKIANKGVSKIIWIPDNDETGKRTLKRNINKTILHYPPSLNLENYIFNIPKEYKDFNEYLINNTTTPLDKVKIFDYNDIDLEWNFKKRRLSELESL